MSVLYLFCGKRILLDNSCALHKYYALMRKTNEWLLIYSDWFLQVSLLKKTPLNIIY